MFLQLYPDVMGNYVLRLYGVFNLQCFGRWNSHYFIIFHFIPFFLFNSPNVMGNYVLRLCVGFNLLCFGRWNSQNLFLLC